MKIDARSIVAAACLLPAAICIAAAQDAEPQKPKSYLERTFSLSGQLRERWESTDGANFSITRATSYVESRIRLGLAYKPASWLRVFSEAQDARVMFYRTKPSGAVDDPFDLRQAYVEMGALEGTGVKAKVGRQELFIGSTRLIVTGDWGNVTRTFDVARGTVTTSALTLDLIGGSAVLPDPNRMDRHRPGEHFYVAYSTFKKLIPGASVEPYLMAKTQFSVK